MMCLSRPWKKATQSTIDDWAGEECKFTNIEPVGDPIVARRENDRVHRMGYQNIRGTTLNSGLDIPEELAVMKELGIDTQGMLEINKPWRAGNRWKYQMMMDIMFSNSESAFLSAPVAHDCKSQPGGNLLILVGNRAGRAQEADGDKWGRFSPQTIRGARDEGIIVITAYRVYQETQDNPGLYTMYTQQYTAMREQRVKNPNPRKQILTDLLTLIR